MNIKNKAIYILKAPISHFYSKKYKMPNVMSDSETLDYILDKKCSVARYGDGEMNIMRGIGIKFQRYDRMLAQRLYQIAAASSNDSVLVCVPNIFQSTEAFTASAKSWWKKYLYCTRGFWYKLFRQNVYGDTNISRFYVENTNRDRDEYVCKLKSIWNDKRILIVEGSKSRLGMGNDLFANALSVKRLLCPDKNAFDKYDEILAEVRRHLASQQQDMLICALGPTATVLCYDIANVLQALDMGHVDIEYEWYLQKATYKCEVNNKAVTEVTDSCGEITSQEYRDQVIGVIE